ncbi:unnamed protein product [Spirodela intermedia]|uniref:Uncharacterized protein n=1 Tax=Spirodela intermedia TaxID=51605 RepID=A0A7I8IWZ2_SPIIN|nr:unnamed protein product [Spirodela intermedia]CAA6662115.1 unnamed protein product [Spirodela intermedia]
MECSADDGSTPAISEESGDSEHSPATAAAAATLLSDVAGSERDDDGDAESCIVDGGGGFPRRGYESDDDGEEDDRDYTAIGWRPRLAEEEKPIAGTVDRIFWERCLEHGYP